MNFLGLFCVIFLFRSLFDSLIFIGGYFDYMLMAAVLTSSLQAGVGDAKSRGTSPDLILGSKTE